MRDVESSEIALLGFHRYGNVSSAIQGMSLKLRKEKFLVKERFYTCKRCRGLQKMKYLLVASRKTLLWYSASTLQAAWVRQLKYVVLSFKIRMSLITLNVKFCILKVPGHMKLKGYEKLQKLNERYIGSGMQFIPGQSQNVTHISRLQVDNNKAH